MDLLIKDGRVIDPATGQDGVADILISESKIRSIGPKIAPPKNATILDASDLIVMPGLVDMHCHLRDPGDPEEETIASGTRSAALGGFTSIACMANTSPVIDTPALVKYIKSKAQMEGAVNVFPIGAVTKGLKGEELAEMGRMIAEGAVGFSDDGKPVVSAEVFRRALEYARQFDVAVISHAEDPTLSAGGQMNESLKSTVLGLKGIPRQAEESMVMRDIMLAREFGRVHITHISTAGSVELVRMAKAEGVPVTCDTCPHYFTITEEEIEGYNTYAKVNPPLRGEKDLEAVIAGLKDGTIDAISTDHAPHREEEKNIEFGHAASGMVGFETALALVLTELVEPGSLTLKKAIEKMTVNPARILNIKKGVLKVGWDGDAIIVDPNAEWTVNIKNFTSRSKNSPYDGWKLKGKVLYSIVGGRIVVKDGQLTV
ncbi:MAG TPA: dihydroorotase [Candidatus Omnitrophota bacterium]|nr:dihydroorotase [Candidatus Omnitrophota bacterium]